MNELERLLYELFPENMNSKVLRLRRAVESQFLASIKELSKQGISQSEAIHITLNNMGGRKKILQLIKKSNTTFFTSKYFILMASLLLGYPLIVFIVFQIFSVDEFSLLLLFPLLFGIAMLVGKLNAVILDARTNRYDDLNNNSDNTTVFSGGGIKYKEK